MWTLAITFWFPKHRFKENVYLDFFIKEKQFDSQVVFLVKSKHWVLAEIWFLCVCDFLAGFLFKSSFFSKFRLCTRPLLSHFETNLDQLAGQPILWIPPWSQSCARQLYGYTTLQSQSLLNNIERSLCKNKLVNNRIIPSTHAERKITVHSHKHSFTPYPSLSSYRQIDRMTDRWMNTLTVRGMEELFFQLCCCVSFWFWREIGFGFIYLCT